MLNYLNVELNDFDGESVVISLKESLFETYLIDIGGKYILDP